MVVSLILVHGAGSGPWVFADWAADFPGLAVHAIDLQENLDPAGASMEDYRDVVAQAARRRPRPRALLGWSMGGLVTLMAAQPAGADALIVIEPSPPAEIRGWRRHIEPRRGTFDPEEEYGPLPQRLRPRPESRLARDQRKRGVSVGRVACPLLVVYGRDFPDDRGRRVAEYYDADHLSFPELSHTGLVTSINVRRHILTWLTTAPEGPSLRS